MENKYWVIGSNKWSKDLYTKEEAKQYAKTLIDCVGCIDCRFCENCIECECLMFCKDCKYSVVCTHSRGLESCKDIHYSENLFGKRDKEFTKREED